jgi:hypothetical protein
MPGIPENNMNGICGFMSCLAKFCFVPGHPLMLSFQMSRGDPAPKFCRQERRRLDGFGVVL